MSQNQVTLPNTATPTPETRPEAPQTISRTNSRGLIEVVDIHTGRVLCVQVSFEDLLESKWDRLVKIDTPQGTVWIEKGLNPDMIPQLQPIPYSRVLADLLCERIAVDGMTLKAACEKMNLSYAMVLMWKRTQEEFKLNLLQAEKDLALHYQHEVVDAARTRASTKDKIAALQWAAEKADPEKYGTKTKIVGDKNAPISFVLDTGIRRTGDAGFEPPPPERQIQGVDETVCTPQVEEYSGEVKHE